ncbi:hypothetical protein BCY91_13760 [Pelobium manganitolerans]|uniref:Signal transduction histidine kinase internal region domain-containing protein n=1 Tax=Pelobium manganitolerans TaxID=1842495 RepID=A0A419SAK2_9SPHI|nr:histidine kinase [Pelobium manganitolerans]RKD19084.1 hypothetical protein BCY91_13760 [Pelobium manganitolerans]
MFLFLIAVFASTQYYTLIIFHIDSKTAFQDSVISNATLVACCWLIVNSLSFYRPKGYRYLFVIIWCKALAALGIYILYLAFQHLQLYVGANAYLFELSVPVRFMFFLLFIGSMAVTSVLWYHQEEAKSINLRKAETEKLTKDMELASLREKLQPHFLFNSLNSISSLILSQPTAARKMVHQLSDFLRGTLRKDDALTDLKQELAHLNLYLEIERMRFGNRLNTEIKVDDEALALNLPPMLLQPLVENAIKFGLYDNLEAVKIQISASYKVPYLVVAISNPFDASTSHGNKGTGFGLASTARRLQLLYNRNDLLHTERQNQQFTATLKIPQND